LRCHRSDTLTGWPDQLIRGSLTVSESPEPLDNFCHRGFGHERCTHFVYPPRRRRDLGIGCGDLLLNSSCATLGRCHQPGSATNPSIGINGT
jgi:hypothetical protein